MNRAGTAFLCGTAGIAILAGVGAPRSHVRADATRDTVTFTRDIAPIVFENCSGCHRPGEVAPFSLLSYEDARPWAARIAEVTSIRYMPPWLPEPGYRELEGERRLSDEQIALIRRWVDDGAIEGDPADLLPTPTWTEGWQLGEPDLVLEMLEPYTVPAEGTDIYRNFVIPVPLDSTRYVRAVELRPGNLRVVHHSVLMIDRTPSSRLMSERDPDPGYEGMHSPTNAHLPEGFFVGWAPGKMPSFEPVGTAWPLDGETELVLQLHLRPSGTPETVRAVAGLYLTDDPPTHKPVTVKLVNELLDIPAGEKNYVVRDEFPLPVDVAVLSVYPHAHYLGKEMRAFATLPDGRAEWLLYIKDWDFNWQDQYRLANPVVLPQGSTLHMEYTFDNSAENPQNLNRPPKRVLRGLRSSDEMAELHIQLLARDATDTAILESWLSVVGSRQTAEEYIVHYRKALEVNPDDAEAHYKLGVALDVEGRSREARTHLREAIRLQPGWWRPMESLAWILASSQDGGARDPAEAVRWSDRAAELTQRQVPAVLDVLAASYAAAGEFNRAVATAEQASRLALAEGRTGLAKQIEDRLALYRQRRPYVRPATR